MTEQRSKVDAVIKSGRQVAMETHWPQGTGESLRSQYGGLEERWRKLWSEGEQWGQLLQSVHPELEKFQVWYFTALHYNYYTSSLISSNTHIQIQIIS